MSAASSQLPAGQAVASIRYTLRNDGYLSILFEGDEAKRGELEALMISTGELPEADDDTPAVVPAPAQPIAPVETKCKWCAGSGGDILNMGPCGECNGTGSIAAPTMAAKEER